MENSKMPELKIRSVTGNDYEIINRLCNERFGEGYLSRSEFDKWLENPDLFLAAEQNGKFVGYVCFVIESSEEISRAMKLELDYVKTSAKGRSVIHCRSTALSSEFEHKGLMKKMWNVIMENAGKTGAFAAFGPAWKYNGFIPMHGLLTSLGFEPIGEKENLWYDDENYKCVICKDRCRCQAVIYRYNFK